MKAPDNSGGRALQIELARARIALERERVARSAKDLGRELAPGHLAARLFARTAANVRVPGWLRMAPGVFKRYPMLISVACSVLSAGRRRSRWRWAGAAVLGGLAWLTVKAQGYSKVPADPGLSDSPGAIDKAR